MKRCKHDVAIPDCFSCYPPEGSAKPFPPRVWLIPEQLTPEFLNDYGQTSATTKRCVMADEEYLSLTEHESLLAAAKAQGRAELLDEWIRRLTEQCVKERGFPLSERGEGGQDARIDLVSYMKADRAKLRREAARGSGD